MSGYTTTPNYGLRKPIVGADNDLWGGDWNTNADSLDTLLKNTNNALAGYLPLAGGTMAGAVGFTDGSSIGLGSTMMPDLVWWRRDTSGNIVQGMDFAGTALFQNTQTYGTGTVATLNATTATIASETFTTLTLAGVGDATQAGNALVPDLARWVRGDNGQLLLGFGGDGDIIVKSLTATVGISAPNISGGSGTASAPSDTLDITKYGGLGDGADDVFLGTWSSGGNALSIIKYSGPISWSATTLTLTNLTGASPAVSGPGFDPNVVGMSIWVGATDASGVNQTVTITGWTSAGVVTVSASPTGAVTTANVTWPAFTSAAVNKSIRVEGGSTSNTRQSYNNGSIPWLGQIATVVDGHSITVTGPVQPNFSQGNNGRPCRVSWGTDNTAAYIAAQTDLAPGVKAIWHPRAAGRGKTVYCAFTLAQRGGSTDNYYVLITAVPAFAYMATTWTGDPSVVGVLTDCAGRLMPKRVIPARSPQPVPAVRDIIGKLHMPRTAADTAPSVVEVGDSLTKYDPTGQSDAWYPVNTFEWLLQQQNPSKTFSFNNIANIGVGWSEMVDPGSGLPWVISGTDLYFMSSSGNNDGWRMHPLKIMSGINLALGSGNDGAGRHPDILLTTAALKGDTPSTGNPGASGYLHEAHLFAEVLLRTMARRQGYGLVDLSWQSEQVLHGASNYHRELQQLPEVNGWTLGSATPFQMLTDCYAWSMMASLSTASNVWAAIGALKISLSPMPGNEFILDVDPATGFLRYEGRLWGRSVATTVSTVGASIGTQLGSSLSSGTLTWVAGQNQLTFAPGGLTGSAGQCIYLPGLDVNGQHERTYVQQVINDTTIVVDDFWWGAPAGTTTTTGNVTTVPVIGGQVFLPADAVAGSDVVMTWGTSSVYRGKIATVTNANTATLSPAPPALTNQVVQMWIGRAFQPATVTTQTTTGASVVLRFSLNKDVLSLRYGSLTVHFFKGIVERFGNRYAPRISITGAGPVTANFTNLYGDRDVYYQPAGTLYDIWGNGEGAMSTGGSGGHDTAMLAERITRRAYEALDLCAM